MAARLKVFEYSDGLTSWTVAASSRAKALAAWGVERDLFKDGSARQIESGLDYDAALARPGELIERGLAPKVSGGKAKARPKASRKAREAVRALEAELEELDAAHRDERDALADRRRALDAEIEALATEHDRARAAIEKRLKAAKAKLA